MGRARYDDRALYEKLILDGFQAGLSWITILRKRDNFRRAFDDFEPAKIARYTPKRVEKLMGDAGIVRNRAKIEGTIKGARAYLDIMEKGGFAPSSGISSTARRRSTASAAPDRFRPRPRSRSRSPRSSPRAGSSSADPPSSTRSCRRSAWSTTTW